jgi:CheY-like chemotaxis protein
MGKLRVLIVEDMGSERSFIRDGLQNGPLHIETEEASSGREAQLKLENGHFDLILCDWEAPVVKGDELLKWLRTHPLLKDIPFIMIIAKGERTDVVRAMQAGVNGYMVRPFTIEALLQKITAVDQKFDRRDQERVDMSGTVTLRFRGRVSSGKLIDVSSGGVLGIFDVSDPLPHILEKALCDVQIDKGLKVSGLEGFLLRAQAVEASPDARDIKIAVKFLETPEDKADELKALLRYL